MYTVTIRRTFSAAHTIAIGGVKEAMHGHNFAVEISLESMELDGDGVVVDFRTVKNHADIVLKEMDHSYLNDLTFFKTIPPTSENIARHIFERMEKACASQNAVLSQVTVWESESARATYRRGNRG
ncbi:MAG: hypothetical protein AVO39_00375 [delta proteobacterium MLS_D]|jgi:6-pyruvoyltetrahydropterin/6-carboxytetrahydropterin synthase|nr:MAG: hypothetical protein AVO39_00375 [delta proteobacterium MLS_D]